MLGNEPKREAKQQKGWRLGVSLVDYVEQRGKGGPHGAETRIVEDAIGLHKKLYEATNEHKTRLARYALDVGLDLREQEPEVFARLMLAGLAAHEDAQRRRK